jgi:hypothetical protein
MALGFYNPHHAEPCIVKGDEEATAPETRRLGDMELCCFKLKVSGFPFLARGRLCSWCFVLGEGIQSFCLHLSAEKGFTLFCV